jgi:lysine biosynthesis protein LysW
MTTTFCPECEHSLNLGAQPYEGQQVICPECRARLEVVSLKPLELDWVYEKELFKNDFEVPAAFSRGKVGSYF